MAPPHFNEAEWIARFAGALEAVAANARPSYSPLPPETMRSGPIDEHWSALHRGYRSLAAQAKHDSTALRQFNESTLWVETDPAEARAILREHPLIKPGLVSSGKDEGVGFRILNRYHRPDLTWLVKCLAKLSVKEGGEEAARRLHRYLTAAADMSVPAYEIIVFHGLVVTGRVDLGRGAYLAPYEYARVEFDLPDEPEPFPKTSYPNAAVLVRGLRYGPGVAPPDEGPGPPQVQVSYDFPTEYQMDLEHWFYDSKHLVDLLSIAARVPLLSRTRYVRLAKWIEEIDPNFAFGTQDSGGFVSDVWPEGRELSKDDVDAFLALSHGWHTYPGKSDAMNIAVRRLAASFSRPGGRFGEEDRILDVAIALEIMYGPFDGGEIAHKLRTRAAWLLGTSPEERLSIVTDMKAFYKARSTIAHGSASTDRRDLERALPLGRDLACHTLTALLTREPVPDWDRLVVGGLPSGAAR